MNFCDIGIGDGQTVRMSVGSREILITFRVRFLFLLCFMMLLSPH